MGCIREYIAVQSKIILYLLQDGCRFKAIVSQGEGREKTSLYSSRYKVSFELLQVLLDPRYLT